MIKKAVHEAELIYGMQRELQSYEKKEAMGKLVKAGDLLQAAMEIFEASGLTAQADKVLSILAKIAEDHKSGDKHHKCEKCGAPTAVNPKHPKESLYRQENGKYLCHKCEGDSHSVDDQDAKHKAKKAPSDPHTNGLTSEKQVENLKHHGTVFNMSDDKADTLLNDDINDADLEVEDPSQKDFEDEEDSKVKTAAKYGQLAAPPPPGLAPVPPGPAPAAPPVAAAVPAVVPAKTPAEAAAGAAAKKAALEAAKAAATAAKAAAEAAVKASSDAAAKLKELETGASFRALLSKYSDNAAPSAHVRSWDPSAKGTPPSEKPTINHVEGNIGTGGLATDPKPGLGVDAPSHKATDNVGGVNAPDQKATDVKPGEGVDAPSHKATEETPGKGVDAPSHKATDGDSSHAETAGGAPLDDDKPSSNPAGSSDVRSPTSTEVRSPTSTEVRSPTSTEVRSPTSTEVRSPTSTSTEVRSPTSTSTEAYTADNFTATVTGGAGDGANTTVNIYLTPPTTPKTNPNVPHASKDKKSSINYLMAKYGDDNSFAKTKHPVHSNDKRIKELDKELDKVHDSEGRSANFEKLLQEQERLIAEVLKSRAR